jgi:hypothetical protein
MHPHPDVGLQKLMELLKLLPVKVDDGGNITDTWALAPMLAEVAVTQPGMCMHVCTHVVCTLTQTYTHIPRHEHLYYCLSAHSPANFGIKYAKLLPRKVDCTLTSSQDEHSSNSLGGQAQWVLSHHRAKGRRPR